MTSPEKIRASDGSTYDWVNARVFWLADRVEFRYQASELDRVGSDSHEEEGLQHWSDKDLQRLVGQYLSIVPEDYSKILIAWC